jgi:hypothetical protein
MADNVRFDVIAGDQYSSNLDRAKTKVDALRASLDQLNQSQYRNVPGIGDKIASDLQVAEKELQNLEAQSIRSFAAIEGFSTRAVAAMRGIPDAVAPASRALGKQDEIMRAGTRGGVIFNQSLSDAIKTATGLGATATITSEQVAAMFGGKVLTGAQALKQELATLGSGAMREREALKPFSDLVSTMRQGEEQTRKTGSGFRSLAGDIDMSTYAGRKFITLSDEAFSGRRGQMMATIGSIFRDLGVSGGGAVAGIAGISAVFSSVKLAETLSRWSEEMGKVALQQENMAAATGQSVDEFITFSTAVQLAGGNAETASRALETLQRRMEEAVLNPTGKTMDAFRAVGLSWETLRARLQDPQGAKNTLLDLSDAFVRLGNTAERTTRFTQIAGGTRQLAQIVPILRQGSEGMKGLEQQADDLNPALHTNHDNLVRMEERIRGLSTAWEGFKASVVGGEGLFSGLITGLTGVLRDLQSAQSYHYDNLKDLQQKGLGAGMPGLNIPSRQAQVVASASIMGTGGALANQAALTGGVDTSTLGTVNLSEADSVLAALGGRPGTQVAAHAGQLKTGLASQYQPEEVQSNSTTGFTEEAAERLYQARLKIAELAAKQLNQSERQQAILKQEADFAAMGPDARAAKMQEVANLSAADAKSQTELLAVETQQWNLAKELSQQDQQALLAGLKKQETEARGREDLAKVVELRKQEQAIISASPYSTEAQKIEAGTQLLQAQIELRKQGVQLSEEAVSAQQKANTDILRTFEAQMQSGVKKGFPTAAGGTTKITEQQAYGFGIQEAKILEDQDKSRLDTLMKQADAIYGVAEATKGSVAQTKIYWEEWQLGVGTMTKIAELTEKVDAANAKAAEKSKAAWNTFFSSVDSAANKFFENAITKSQTFQKSVQELGKSLLSDAFKLGSDVIGRTITTSITGQAGKSMAEFLGDKASSLFTSAAGSATGTAASSGISSVASAIFTPIVTAVTSLGGLLGGLLTTLITTTGATAVKPEFLGTSYSMGGIVPSAAGGMIVGGGGQLAILHPREMVLPAHLSTGMQNMISRGGGGGTTNAPTLNYSPTIAGSHPLSTASDMERVLRQHGGTMMKYVENAARNGWHF